MQNTVHVEKHDPFCENKTSFMIPTTDQAWFRSLFLQYMVLAYYLTLGGGILPVNHTLQPPWHALDQLLQVLGVVHPNGPQLTDLIPDFHSSIAPLVTQM